MLTLLHGLFFDKYHTDKADQVWYGNPRLNLRETF